MSEVPNRAIGLIFLLVSSAPALSQTFTCNRTAQGGLEIYGTNPLDRVVRCDVQCDYWRSDQSQGYQKCTAPMQPNSSNVKYCAFNLNDASQVIGTSQSCR
jgi:hypothetical protein